MLAIDEAVRAVLDRTVPRASIEGALIEGALENATTTDILAREVRADRDAPPFDKALVDGFAIRADDLRGGPAGFEVVEEVTAGRVPSRRVGPGQAVSIMTGAPMPEGADAVVMVELATREGDRVTLGPPRPPRPGDGWMPRGREMRAGDVVARPGERMTAARIGLLASVGCAFPAFSPLLTAHVVSTGDELVEPEDEPGPGQIRNANAPMLRALLTADGVVTGAPHHARDDPGELADRLRGCLGSDLLLITGGVSAGKLDLVPGILERLGVRPIFHKVRLKPGKPLFFGVGPTRDGDRPGTLVFGLPGNPVSGLVGYLLFVRPARRKLAGEPISGPHLRHGGMLAKPFTQRGDRPTYHPARWIEPEPGLAAPARIDPLPWAGSPDLRTVADADGFAVFPAGDVDLPAGTPLAFLPL